MRIASSSADFPPGAVIDGRYRVVRVLGRGGMGVVLEATHESLGTRVAVKVMGRRVASMPGFSERFLREARAASALRSDYVARVTDFGSIDGVRPYMVMEHLQGEDLGEVLARGPLPVAEAVDAVAQAAAGLVEAHASGIVHRDLKPSNLFRTRRPDGSVVVKVLDFGIAKKLEPEATGTLTSTGQVLGTPMYMSPEQIRTPREIDARSDVWSLGIVLFELLAGRTPFEEEEMGPMLAAILERPAPDVRSVRPDVPEPLAVTIARCLVKRRDDRLASVSALAELLSPFASEEGRLAAQRARGAGAGMTAVSVPDVALAAQIPTVAASGFETTTLVASAARLDGEALPPAGVTPAARATPVAPSRPTSRRWPWLVVGALVLGGGATAGWLARRAVRSPEEAPALAAAPSLTADAPSPSVSVLDATAAAAPVGSPLGSSAVAAPAPEPDPAPPSSAPPPSTTPAGGMSARPRPSPSPPARPSTSPPALPAPTQPSLF